MRVSLFTTDGGCCAGDAADRLATAVELAAAEAAAGTGAGWTGHPSRSLWSLSVAIDSLMSFSFSTDADLGKTK